MRMISSLQEGLGRGCPASSSADIIYVQLRVLRFSYPRQRFDAARSYFPMFPRHSLLAFQEAARRSFRLRERRIFRYR